MDVSELLNVKKAFTEVNICEDSGIVLMNEDADPNYVKKIRLWNLLEGFLVYGLILLIVWASMLDTSLWWMWAGLGGLLIWTLILTPIIHYKYEKDLFLTEEQKERGIWFYVFECRGLGSAKRYFFSVDGEEPNIKRHYKTLIALTIFIDILFIALFVEYDDVANEILGGLATNVAIKVLLEIVVILILDAVLLFLAYPVISCKNRREDNSHVHFARRDL